MGKGKDACCKCCGSSLCLAAIILLVIGGLNWGLVGLFNFNVVTALFGAWPVLVQIVYVLVGLAALYKICVMVSK